PRSASAPIPNRPATASNDPTTTRRVAPPRGAAPVPTLAGTASETGRVEVRSSASLAAPGPDEVPGPTKLVDQSARGCAVERPPDDLSRSGGAAGFTASMALRRWR